jgi:hypothetical protein
LCRIRGNSEHLGFGVKANDLPCEKSEPDCELAGPAAKIEHAVILAEADDLSNASDQYRRVWGPAATVIRCRFTEAMWFKGRRIGQGALLTRAPHFGEPHRAWPPNP